MKNADWPTRICLAVYAVLAGLLIWGAIYVVVHTPWTVLLAIAVAALWALVLGVLCAFISWARHT